MRNLTATICLTIAVLLGSAGVSWSAEFQKGLTAANIESFCNRDKQVADIGDTWWDKQPNLWNQRIGFEREGEWRFGQVHVIKAENCLLYKLLSFNNEGLAFCDLSGAAFFNAKEDEYISERDIRGEKVWISIKLKPKELELETYRPVSYSSQFFCGLNGWHPEGKYKLSTTTEAVE